MQGFRKRCAALPPIGDGIVYFDRLSTPETSRDEYSGPDGDHGDFGAF
jgi:hypothetical protein